MKKLLLLLISVLSIHNTTFSENLNPKFTEISFKNKTADFIVIELPDQYDENLEVKDDNIIAKISPEEIEGIEKIIIYFKAEEEQLLREENLLKIFVIKSGLTATTEQLILTSEDKIIDIVCWQNSSPPASEQKDIAELIGIWDGECLNSEEISENKSIMRSGEEINANSWKVPKTKNNPPTAIISVQKGSLENTIPFSINLDGSNSSDSDGDKLKYEWLYPGDQIFNTKNPPSFKFEKAGKFSITLTLSDGIDTNSTFIEITANEKPLNTRKLKKLNKAVNGTLSKEVKFSEIFPNPKGKDAKMEWIELFNSSSKKVNLQNWKIESGGKKHKLLNLSIEAGQYLLIKTVPLKNSNNTLKLLDFQDQLIDQATYSTTQEGLSMNKIITQEEEKWLLLKPNPLLPPPAIKNLQGLINTTPQIAEEFFFQIKNSQNQIITINFREPFNFKKLETELQKNTEISVSTEIIEKKYFLLDYKIEKLAKPEKEKSSFNYLLFIPILLCGVLFFHHIINRLRKFRAGNMV